MLVLRSLIAPFVQRKARDIPSAATDSPMTWAAALSPLAVLLPEECARCAVRRDRLPDDLTGGVDAMSPARPVAGQRSKIQHFAVLAEERAAIPLADDLPRPRHGC